MLNNKCLIIYVFEEEKIECNHVKTFFFFSYSLFQVIVRADESNINDEYLEINAGVLDCVLQTNKHSEDVIICM